MEQNKANPGLIYSDEKEITVTYSHLRSGLVQLLLNDYFTNIIFEQNINIDRIKIELQERLRDSLKFETTVVNINFNEEDTRIEGSVSIQLSSEYLIVNFCILPTGFISDINNPDFL